LTGSYSGLCIIWPIATPRNTAVVTSTATTANRCFPLICLLAVSLSPQETHCRKMIYNHVKDGCEEPP
jgi:hypothetical protein